MLEFSSHTSIGAPAQQVWDALVDTNRWPDWDHRLDRVDGRLAADGRITIHVHDSNRPFRLAVSEWQPHRRIVLRGGMPLGLFAGIREYVLTERAGNTGFEMTERYTGLLAPLITKSIPDLQPSFAAFAAGLRAAATD